MDEKAADARQRVPLAATMRGVGERLKAWALGNDLPTEVEPVGTPTLRNPQPESRVGNYRSLDARRAVLADMTTSCRL